MSSSAWPPALKTYVNETFAKCTDQNRIAVEAELKSLIFKAFEAGNLWSIDWTTVKLNSLATPKKRKSTIPALPLSTLNSPSAAHESNLRDKRARRFIQDPSSSSLPGSSTNHSLFTTSRLVQGGTGGLIYANGAARTGGYTTPEVEGVRDPNVIDWDKETIVGTSTKIEKPFLRLTTIPDPRTIRPLEILKQTLEFLKRKWKEEGNYGFVCDQFKSMRQDLTVQRLKNEFTVTVYEIHARIALEKGDLVEFNQCQGQLVELYKHGLPGRRMEFLGYRILYLLFARNRSQLNTTLALLTPTETSDPSVVHAIAVRQALAKGNYTRFFRLFCEAPKMGAYLMDHFVGRERVQALVTMTKAYQQLPISLVVSQLAFETPSEAIAFLTERNAAIFRPGGGGEGEKVLDCKQTHGALVKALGEFVKVDIKGSFS